MIDRIAITSHEQWMSLRGRDFTASIAGALVGEHPYTTEYEQWALRSGLITKDTSQTESQERGQDMEEVAVKRIRRRCLDWQLEPYPHGYYYRDPEARIGATPDLLARDRDGRLGVVQIKTIERWIFRRDWVDESGIVRLPLWVAVQNIVEAHLVGAEWAAAALLVGFNLDLFIAPVPIHPGVIAKLRDNVAAFWRSVETGIPRDPDASRDGRLIEQLFNPQDVEPADLTGDNGIVALLEERARLTTEKSHAEERLAEIKAELLLKLRGARSARLADGRLLTTKRVECAAYTVDPHSYVKISVKEEKHDSRRHHAA